MPNIDHTQDSGIFQMVQNRLNFVQDSQESMVSTYIWELMNEFNVIFRKEQDDIGNEINYGPIELSFLADMACIYMITWQAASNSANFTNITAGNPFNKYIKKAEADGVLVEYDIVKGSNVMDTMVSMGADGLMKFFRDDATRKAWFMGFRLVFTDFGFQAWLFYQGGLTFIVPDKKGGFSQPNLPGLQEIYPQ